MVPSSLQAAGPVAASGLYARVLRALILNALRNAIPGVKLQCPCCGWVGRSFLDYVDLGYTTPCSVCPRCESHSRHRALSLRLRDPEMGRLCQGRALILAPERCLDAVWTGFGGMHAIRVDIDPSRGVDLIADICRLPLASCSIDLVSCHHVIGLLMGLERERNPAAKSGLRTFALTALLGVLTAHLATALGEQWLIVVGLLLVGAMMIAAYLHAPQQPDGDPGTTTVAALMLCYGLGVLVWQAEIQLAVMLGIAATMLLYFKPELRGLSQHMSRRDLLSILQFSVLALIVLPLLPNQNYGPYGALNPHQIWWMVVLIAGVGLAGYAALRLVGQQRGAVMLGLLGGLVSSTATTLAFSRHARASDTSCRFR